MSKNSTTTGQSKGNRKEIKEVVDYWLSKLGDSIIIKDNYLYPNGYDKIPIHNDIKRRIQYISQAELSEAMLSTLKNCTSATRDKLCTDTMHLYGFRRTSQQISNAMTMAIDSLLEDKRIIEENGILKIKS